MNLRMNPQARVQSSRRSQKPNSQRRQVLDPRAMSTERTGGSLDPPQITENVVGVKKLRKKITLTAGPALLTLGDVRNCLNLWVKGDGTSTGSPDLRVMKLSAWAPASAGGQLTVQFPVQSAVFPGDNAVWKDEGTQGSLRPQVHLLPNFEARSKWLVNTTPDATVIGNFSGNPTEDVIVDITVEFRTRSQPCSL